MRARTLLLVVTTSFLLGGCAASLHQVAPEKESVFDASMLGKWKEVKKDPDNIVYTIEKEGADGYRISFVDEGKTMTQVYTAHIFKLGSALFYDATFSKIALKGETMEPGDMAVYRTHGFGRVWMTPDEIKLGPLNEEWLETLDEKKLMVKYEKGDSDAGADIVLTGSPEELRAFAQKYADDQGAFPAGLVYRRIK
jgi:hypothetical protein